MRTRNTQLNVRLTPSEYDKVLYYSRKANLPISAYIRMLINGYVPKEAPPIEYEQLMKQLTDIHAKMTAGQSIGDSAELLQIILQLQATLTLPDRMNV